MLTMIYKIYVKDNTIKFQIFFTDAQTSKSQISINVRMWGVMGIHIL